MKHIRYMLVAILLIPSISHAIYRIYIGNIGQNNAELYFDEDSAIFLDGKEHNPKRLEFIKESDNKFNFSIFYPYKFKELSKIFLENFDYIKFRYSAEVDTYRNLNGYTLYGDKINLNRIFQYAKYDKAALIEAEFNNIDFLQRFSTKDFYFKVIISKQKNEEAKVIGIKIYSKNDGHLIQTITDIEKSKFFSSLTIRTHDEYDFNFDGDNNDFYISKNKTHGKNTIEDYYVYDKTQQKFIKLNLNGTSFLFDSEEKKATSTKICPGTKKYSEIIVTDSFQYTGNNHYKLLESDCQYQERENINHNFEYKMPRACTLKEITDCKNYTDNQDDDDESEE